MNIKLVGPLNEELRDVGLKAGMKFQDVSPAPGYPKGTIMIFCEKDDAYVPVPVRSYYYEEISKWPRITFNRSILKFKKQLKTS